MISKKKNLYANIYKSSIEKLWLNYQMSSQSQQITTNTSTGHEYDHISVNIAPEVQ